MSTASRRVPHPSSVARAALLGVLYVYGPTFRFPAEGDADRISAIVLDRAERISAELGWSQTSYPGPMSEAS